MSDNDFETGNGDKTGIFLSKAAKALEIEPGQDLSHDSVLGWRFDVATWADACTMASPAVVSAGVSNSIALIKLY